MTDGLEYLGRARFQGLTLLGVAFLVGCLAGFAGNRLMEVRDGRRPPPPAGPPEGRREGRLLPRPLEDLQLSAAQRRQVDSLLQAGRPRAEAILRESLPRLQALRDSVEHSIREVLTAAQRDSFDSFNKAHPHRTLGPPGPGDGKGGPGAGPDGPRGWRRPRPGGPPGWRGEGPPPWRRDGPPPPPDGDPGPPEGPDGPPPPSPR